MMEQSTMMDIDEDFGLELVPDDFGQGTHESQDALLCRTFRLVALENFDDWAPNILEMIIQLSGGRLFPKAYEECKTLLKSEPKIKKMILDGFNDGFKFQSVRRLKLLRPVPSVSQSDEHAIYRNVEEGWKGTYRGDAAKALWAQIEAWDAKASDKKLYAKYCTIVQSSGTGKSRVIDELSKSHLVIPVVLRDSSSTGYPPSDTSVLEWLLSSKSQREAFINSCSFLHAVFSETHKVLQVFGWKPVAEGFRCYMTQGMKSADHGEQRQTFYSDVIRSAKELRKAYESVIPNQSPSDSGVDKVICADNFLLSSAFVELSKFTKSLESPRSHDTSTPSVILAFDEVHTLGESKDAHSWSRFGEIRRAIRGLLEKPLFTIFLSTSGTLFSIASPPGSDISARMLHEHDVLSFCELGFDQHAKKVDVSQGQIKLSDVTSEDHLVTYGRPLWVTYQKKQSLIAFAALKLLGGTEFKGQKLLIKEKLACLAQRIPIEFLSATYTSQISDAEREQVHSHMRVVLKLQHQNEVLVTTSPSEPILSEAAYFIMTLRHTIPSLEHGTFNAPEALQHILHGFSVNKGELGELIVALLFILARDMAVGNADSSGRPPNKQRWCSLTGLLQSLFVTPDLNFQDYSNVIEPSRRSLIGTRARQQQRSQEPLGKVFKDSKLYFTHFIKAHEQAVVGIGFLMRMMVRGAAILCANGQRGVDGIIPFLRSGEEIREDNIGLIMFQVKNDDHYTHEPKPKLFCDMDTCSLDITSRTGSIAVIRMVFALAAKTHSLHIERDSSAASPQGEGPPVFNIWAAGLSHKLLRPVAEGEQSTWDSILHASHGWKAIYRDENEEIVKLRMSMNPGAGVQAGFWDSWCNDSDMVTH